MPEQALTFDAACGMLLAAKVSGRSFGLGAPQDPSISAVTQSSSLVKMSREVVAYVRS